MIGLMNGFVYAYHTGSQFADHDKFVTMAKMYRSTMSASKAPIHVQALGNVVPTCYIHNAHFK